MANMWVARLLSIFVLFMILSEVALCGEDDPWKVFEPYHQDTSERMVWMEYTDAYNSLYHHLKDLCQAHMESRANEISEIKTLGDWRKHQAKVKNTLLSIIGPFPAKTPLNATVVDIFEKPKYRVEKIIFQSMPGFFVTGCLFIPDNQRGKTPGILFCSGHSQRAFRRDIYQRIVLNLVQKGFIVFAFDPIGQGERVQYYDPSVRTSRIRGGSTREHSYAANQCFISGNSLARYFAWDGIRALDYLASRPEVDTNRLGCHGNSGGGLQTAYVSALDDRVKAAAPSGYFTNFKWLLKSSGVGDGEQNFYHGWAEKIDLPDFIEVRAPKAMLIMCTTRDFFPIRGTHEAYREALRIYQAYQKPDNLQMVQDDFTHGYTKKTREAMYAFFQEHLNVPGDPQEEQVNFLSDRELVVTDTGQVNTSLQSETVFSINKKETQELLTQLEQKRKKTEEHCKAVVQAACLLSGYQDSDTQSIDATLTGRYNEEDLITEKLFLQGTGDYPLPFLLMLPKNVTKKTVILCLNPGGKKVAPHFRFFYQVLLDRGHIVLLPDLIDTGEIGPTEYKGDATSDGVSTNVWYMAIQNGVSIVGIRASDVNRLVLYVKKRFPDYQVAGLSRGNLNTVLLHAAVMNDQIKSIAMFNPLVSYQSLVMNQFYDVNNIYGAPGGVLTAYDLSDLAACFAPRPILIVNAVDQNGQYISSDQVSTAYEFARSIYKDMGANEKMSIIDEKKTKELEKIIGYWSEEFLN